MPELAEGFAQAAGASRWGRLGHHGEDQRRDGDARQAETEEEATPIGQAEQQLDRLGRGDRAEAA